MCQRLIRHHQPSSENRGLTSDDNRILHEHPVVKRHSKCKNTGCLIPDWNQHLLTKLGLEEDLLNSTADLGTFLSMLVRKTPTCHYKHLAGTFLATATVPTFGPRGYTLSWWEARGCSTSCLQIQRNCSTAGYAPNSKRQSPRLARTEQNGG